MIRLTWLSHASWLLEVDDHRVLLDPFFTDNPAAKQSPDEFENISHIIVSHGHFDHVTDVESIGKRCGSTIVANFEIANWYGGKGFDDVVAMNIGGQVQLPFGTLKMVPAVHTSGLPDGQDGGNAAGFVLTTSSGKRIYLACDTAYFSDMKFYADGVDVAVMPMGDLFTMGIDDCVAAIKLIQPKVALPTHYNTWPPIAQDASDWAQKVNATGCKAVVLEVGQTYDIDEGQVLSS